MGKLEGLLKLYHNIHLKDKVFVDENANDTNADQTQSEPVEAPQSKNPQLIPKRKGLLQRVQGLSTKVSKAKNFDVYMLEQS